MKNKNRTPLELYIHIPFCVQKCQYCDFLSGPSDQETRDRYIKALRAEIQAVQGVEAYEIVSVFIGGGTPSVLKAEAIASIMETIQKKFCFSPDAEITIESNPGTVDLAKLNAYRETGINRLSLGLQSTDSKELRMLGRIHTYEEFLQSYQWAREAGFQNINIDLMFAIPGQTGEAWRAHLRQVSGLYCTISITVLPSVSSFPEHPVITVPIARTPARKTAPTLCLPICFSLLYSYSLPSGSSDSDRSSLFDLILTPKEKLRT